MQRTPPGSIPIKLALQGGGAHGAFTWGVLDRLLELPELKIESISATSSGAMNAAALAQGWQRDGATGAKAALEEFWQALARQNAVTEWWVAAANMLDPGLWSKVPRAPLTNNPLRALVEQSFDIEALCAGPIRLQLAATRVRDGALKLFDNAHLSHDALLASACLPQWFAAVEIDGESYWDGGFAGNPALEPLLLGTGGDDLLCVLLQPLNASEVPRTARDVAELSAQLSFSAAFRRELRDLALTRRRIGTHQVPSSEVQRLSRLRMHVITPEDALTMREGYSAADTRLGHLQGLRELGRQAAEVWCVGHRADLGHRESFGLEAWLDGSP